MKRVLLLGGSGQLGSEIRRRWSGVEFTAPPHGELDLLDSEAVGAALECSGAETLVSCAAFHNVERCEGDAQSAFAANALAVGRLAEICANRGARFVTVSTDYVFDGEADRAYTERDAPSPLNVYGISKFAGELLASRLEAEVYVIRTCGVYGVRFSSSKGHTFADRVLAQARAGEEIRIVSDQTVSPSYAGHIAEAMLQLLESDAAPGIYHAVNEGAVTWYDFACEILRQAGIEHPIEPISYRSWGSKVRRPAYSALENAKLHTLGLTMPSWRDGIAAYLRDRQS